MDGMPRPRPPHLHRQVTQHGKTVWYVRVGKGPRIRIRSAFGTEEFDAEYHSAIAGLPARLIPKEGRTSLGSLAWLVRALSGNGRMDELVIGDTAPAREHPKACTRYGRASAYRPHHEGQHCSRPRPPS